MRIWTHIEPTGRTIIQRSKRAGFTLIELLVVISIIALLVGILLPALGAARKSAMVLKCASREKQVMISMTAYTLDNDGLFPSGWEENKNGQLDDKVISYDDRLSGYDGRETMTQDQMLSNYIFVGGDNSNGSDFYTCPLDELEAFTPGSNNQFFRRTYSISAGNNPEANANAYRQTPGISSTRAQNRDVLGNIKVDSWSAKDGAVTAASSTIALAELSFAQNTMGIIAYAEVSANPNVGPVAGGQNWSGYGTFETNVIGHHDGIAALNEPFSERRSLRTNYAFVDGHVEGLSFGDTLTGITDLTSLPRDLRGTMWDHRQ